MRHHGLRWLAVSSLLVGALMGQTRPQYGGTVRVATRTAISSLDPADPGQPDSFTRRNLTALIFETLVWIDMAGRPQPSLATSWQAAPGNQRWQFRLRKGIKFHDGTPLTPENA